jgi:hypothetical protein
MEKTVKIPTDVIFKDGFFELSTNEQLLFLYLCICVDKDGYIKSPKALARAVKIPEETIDSLIDKKYIHYSDFSNWLRIGVDVLSLFKESE